MSNAVTATGILVKRRATAVPEATVVITSNSIATATSVLTAAVHGLRTGDEVLIAGVGTSVPSINGSYTVTVIDATHFSIPVTVTTAGSGGTVQPTFRTVGELKEVTPGGISRNKIETTTHNDGAESHVLGILRHDDPGMKINYVGTDITHVAILADIAGNVKNSWKILFPSGTSRVGDAYVQQFMFDNVPVDAEQGATLKFTWAGTVTETAA